MRTPILTSRWDRIKKILSSAGYNHCPDSLPQEGLVLNAPEDFKPKIGVWIMPDNNINGMLEDFVLHLAKADNPLLLKATQVLQDIENSTDIADNIRYNNIHRAKAKIHTFLAWQEEQGTPMSLAITKQYLNPHSESCKPFLQWINNLFDPS